MNTPIYYPNLNGLRAIAASLVFFHHFNQIGGIFNTRVIQLTFLSHAGYLGVVLFFVLSGFLITTLLLKEQEVRGDISVVNFYARRILRIWPLYFILVLLGFFIFPNISVPGLSIYHFNIGDFLLFLFFAANVVLKFGVVIPGIAPLWSVSAEEQFYLIWPWLMKIKRGILPIMFFLILVPIVLDFVIASEIFHSRIIKLFLKLLTVFRFDYMAIGGLFAYLNCYCTRATKFFFSKPIQVLSYSLLAIFFLGGKTFPFFSDQIYATLFGILILNGAVNKNSLYTVEFSVLNEIGKISYGLYMYHGSVIFICFHLLAFIFGFNILSNGAIFIVFAITVYSLSVGVAYFSYRYIEIYFLKLKRIF